MGVSIGMDEAGLGPNLGPFVVAATVWEFPGRSTACDLFDVLKEAVSPEPCHRGRPADWPPSKPPPTPSCVRPATPTIDSTTCWVPSSTNSNPMTGWPTPRRSNCRPNATRAS